MGDTGTEQPADLPGNSQNRPAARTLSRTLAPEEQPDSPAGQTADPDLQALIEAWPILPAGTRTKIMALVRYGAKL